MQEMQEMQVRSLGREDPLEKEMATHSSIPACPRMNLAGYSPRGCKELDMTKGVTLSHPLRHVCA